MDSLKRQALMNAFTVVEKLKPGQPITRENLIEALRKPLPAVRECPSDAVILHAYRHYVINAGVCNVHRIVTYEEAATLANKSVEAIRQAAYRGTLMKSTEYRDGRERVGVFLNSLEKWCGWTSQEYQEADRQLKSIRDGSRPINWSTTIPRPMERFREGRSDKAETYRPKSPNPGSLLPAKTEDDGEC